MKSISEKSQSSPGRQVNSKLIAMIMRIGTQRDILSCGKIWNGTAPLEIGPSEPGSEFEGSLSPSPKPNALLSKAAKLCAPDSTAFAANIWPAWQ